MQKDLIIDEQSPSLVMRLIPTQRLPQGVKRSRSLAAGFSLIELVVVTAIVSVLASIAIPAYNNFIDRAKNARAIQEVRILENEINGYFAENGVLPPLGLVTINRAGLLDPWSHPYEYKMPRIRRYGADFLNDDYDLYSKGADGITEELVHVLVARGFGSDDLLRGRNGAFHGSGAAWVNE